jgi:hypothetical protein
LRQVLIDTGDKLCHAFSKAKRIALGSRLRVVAMS